MREVLATCVYEDCQLLSSYKKERAADDNCYREYTIYKASCSSINICLLQMERTLDRINKRCHDT